MIDLQQARREAAERFYRVGMANLPSGWTFAFRKSLSGLCWPDRKHIDGPKPVTRRALYIWLHECAHAHLGHKRGGRKPSHVIELEAEEWAHQRMRAHGIPVPKKSTEAAKRHVGRKIKQAIARGAKTIDAKALRFANKGKRP